MRSRVLRKAEVLNVELKDGIMVKDELRLLQEKMSYKDLIDRKNKNSEKLKKMKKEKLLHLAYKHGANIFRNQDLLENLLSQEDNDIKYFLVKISPVASGYTEPKLIKKIIENTINELINLFLQEEKDEKLSTILKVYTYFSHYYGIGNVQGILERTEENPLFDPESLPITAVTIVECLARVSVSDKESFEKILFLSKEIFQKAAESEDTFTARRLTATLIEVVARFHSRKVEDIVNILIEEIKELNRPFKYEWHIVEYFSRIYLKAVLSILELEIVNKENAENLLQKISKLQFLYPKRIAHIIEKILEVCKLRYEINLKIPEWLKSFLTGKRPGESGKLKINSEGIITEVLKQSKNPWKDYWEILSEHIVKCFLKGETAGKLENILLEIIRNNVEYLKVIDSRYECCLNFIKRGKLCPTSGSK